jgi:type I site-specific restriction-modification system R (restriction) subunit
MIVVDRIDLDTQITATFNAADVPNMVAVPERSELKRLLTSDARKVIITTIHKFGEASGVLNDRKNIIVMVDEAHRTQEGDLGRKMREALPNAFLFGLTGTPINRADRNTFWAFGAEEDEKGYMSRYSFQDSIRDGATLRLHFEAPNIKLKIDKAALDEAFAQLTEGLDEEEKDALGKKAAKMAALVKNPQRVKAIVEHMVQHFREKVEPNGFKAQVVVFDRECCLLYKAEMDKLVANLRTAMASNLGELTWMGEATKVEARDKLVKFTPKIGYTEKFETYDALTVGTDAFANTDAAGDWAYKDMIAKLGEPIDKTEWGMLPQTVNAYYSPNRNEIVFPAAILQPPFFDVNADPAVNYGAIGGVIGHENDDDKKKKK